MSSIDYPPNLNVADVLYEERKQWLDSAATASVRNAKTKAEARKNLASKLETYIIKTVDKAYNAVPAVVPMAMGIWGVDPDLDYDIIAGLLIDDYWKAKQTQSNNVKPGKAKKRTKSTKGRSRNG